MFISLDRVYLHMMPMRKNTVHEFYNIWMLASFPQELCMQSAYIIICMLKTVACILFTTRKLESMDSTGMPHNPRGNLILISNHIFNSCTLSVVSLTPKVDRLNKD